MKNNRWFTPTRVLTIVAITLAAATLLMQLPGLFFSLLFTAVVVSAGAASIAWKDQRVAFSEAPRRPLWWGMLAVFFIAWNVSIGGFLGGCAGVVLAVLTSPLGHRYNLRGRLMKKVKDPFYQLLGGLVPIAYLYGGREGAVGYLITLGSLALLAIYRAILASWAAQLQTDDAISAGYTAHLERTKVEDPKVLAAMKSSDLYDWWFNYGCAAVEAKYPNLGHARALVRAELHRRGFKTLPDHELTEAETEAEVDDLRRRLGLSSPLSGWGAG